MASNERALVRLGALARPDADPAGAGAVRAAERHLADVLAEVSALDAEVEALAGVLADFGRLWEGELADAFAGLDRAERLVRRLQRLEDELARLAERFRAGDLRRTRRPRRPRPAPAAAASTASAAGGEGGEAGGPGARAASTATGRAAAGDADGEALSEEALVKRLYRRLARVLHPDLAADDADRARLGELMARVNAAYAKRDRTALELVAEKLGAGEPVGELTDAERVAHLEKRAATLGRIAASLRREKRRLEGSQTARLRAEALRREEEGRDWAAETRAELAEEAAAAEADALPRLDRLIRAARELSRARKSAMSKIVSKGTGGLRRAFDPLQESELVRRGVQHLERQRATGPARDLARALEDAAATAPADVALTALAFLAEAAGRPPDLLAAADGWETAWERLRAAVPGAPPLPRVLARLPRHLEVGVRDRGDDVVAGVQLASPELVAGVRIALQRDAVAAIARAALAALGPAERCRACAEDVVALHLLRTRGLDELNGLVCPRCGAVLRSYWRYGEVEGLEALAPLSRELGLTAEVVATLGGTAIGFGMLPAERDRLTADRLRRRFAELYLAPYAVELAPEALRVEAEGAPLGPSARVAGAGALALEVDPSAGTAEELLELLRARIERRFRA